MAQTNDKPFSGKKLYQKAEFSRWFNSQPKDDDGFTIIGDYLIAAGNDSTEDMEAAWNASRLAALDDCKTLLERVLSETELDVLDVFSSMTLKDGWYLRRFILLDRDRFCKIYDALAELEALRKKVE